LGMGALILGQVHGLYAGFAALLLGPVIAAGALVRMIRRHPDRWRTATGAVALGLGLPFIYITQSGMRTGSGDAKPDSTSAIASSNNDSFVRLESGKVMLDPRKRMGREWGWRYVLLAAAAAFGLTKAHRRRAGVLVAVLIVAGVVFYVPPVCTLVAERVGSLWALGRMGFVFGLGFIGLVIGAGSVMLEPLLRRRWQRAIVTIVVVLMAIPYSDLTAKDSWPTYMTRCGKSTPWRRDRLDRFRATRAFCDEHIPAGSSVLIDEGNGVTLAMACDCHIIASYSASNGVVDLAERRDDLGRLLQPASKTDWPARRRLLEKYNITHVLAYGWPIEWARGRVSRYWCGGDGVFLELADDLDSARIDAARGPDSDFRLGAGNLAAKRRVADILLDLGETSAGVEAFEGMAKRYGKSAKTQLQYGDVLVKAGDLSGAVEVFRRAVELQPRSGVIHYRLASALSELGRVEEAYDEYERAARLAPEHVRAQRDLGFAALQLRRPGDAASAFRRAIELKPRSADAHFGLAEALTALGRVDRAVKEYREALRLKPNHTRARAGLTTALREMGDSGT